MRKLIVLFLLFLISCDEEKPKIEEKKEHSIPRFLEGVAEKQAPTTFPVQGGPWRILDDEIFVPGELSVWEDPNRMSQGPWVFSVHRGQEVEVLHWMRNRGGIPVFRIRVGEQEGWVLPTFVRDSTGQGVPLKGE